LIKNMPFKKSFPVLLGTIVEYYDYSLYGFCPLILAAAFLPSTDPSVALIATYGVFAIGSLSKPLGSLIFGWIGDNFGRKAALNVTITGIALPTFIIGCMPTYEQIGFLASIALIGCRFLQGVFVAGEYDGAALYIIEHAQVKQKALGSALVRTTGVLGLLIGSLMVAFFTQGRFPSWMWRVPFILSLPLGLITLYLRRKMTETPEFLNFLDKKQSPKKPFSMVLKEHWREIMLVILLCGAFGGTYQISVIFLKSFFPLIMPQTQLDAQWLNPLVIFMFGLSMPIAGVIADRYGIAQVIRKCILLAMVACALMIFGFIQNSITTIMVAQIFLVIGLGPFNALSHALVYSFFNVNHRYRCLSAGHTIGSMVLSGTAPMLCGIFWKVTTISYAPILYTMVLLTLGYIMTMIGGRWQKAIEAVPQPELRLVA
jgi:MHS family proline/betaine transporter-like MFS transporter